MVLRERRGRTNIYFLSPVSPLFTLIIYDIPNKLKKCGSLGGSVG